MEHTAALNLRPLLSEKCVILTGGRDRLNNILIQFPCDSLIDKLSSDDLQNVILYLASIPSFIKKSFVFIIDMRGRKYESVKPILKILQNLQENYQYYIHHVFIIKPDTFWQKQKTSFASSKYNFEQSLISIEQLSKYVDPTQLTQDLEGSLPYNNDQWIEFRIKLEIYINQTNDMLSKFNALQIELSTFEQPDTKEACQEAIIAHTSTKQRVFSMNIEQLLAEAKQLLKILIGHDNNEILLAPVGTRDSGYSGSESEKFNCDYFNEASKIKEPMEQLRIAKQKVQNLWQQKKLKLEQCLQLRVFEQDCSQMMDWLNYNNKSVLMNYTDIGQSFSSAHDLLQKHEQFHKNCFSGAASVQHITSVAGKLIASSHYASNLITLKTNKLEKEWQLFHAALQNRQKILSASCMFHKKADQYLGKVAEWKSQCSSTQLANSVQEAENLLKKHHELSDDISQIYAEVCNDGKAILDSIQSSQSTQIGQMEFKQAASHILDIVYEILSNHRQLELLWVNKKQKLQNRYRMLNFQQNIKQVYNWLENHGEVFLRRNQSLGKNLMRAKMLHLSHENFVKVLKNTITNVEKLLASADDLVMNGEFEPQDIYSMTKELEQRMTLFLQRVEKRKNILDLSVLFHTHVVELDNWFNELKIHWTSLNLNDINQFNLSSIEAINSNIDLFEKHLEILNEQKSVTSDAIDKTILEGDALIDYLKEMGSKNEESNNASNNNSNKQNSHAYLDSIVSSVKSRYNEIDSLLSSIKHRLETNLQIKIFEKDALEASQNLEHWAEELKYLDENQNDERTPESTESWLHSQIQTANQMQVLIFELLQRGSDLAVYLEKIENTTSTPLSTTSTTNSTTSLNDSTQNNNDNKTTTTTTKPNDTLSNNQHTLNWLKQQNSLNNNQISNNLNLTAKQRIQSFVEYLNEREKELHDLAIKQQRKLGQTLQINQLENECTQLLGFISNIEMTLFSMLKFAANLDEAEQCKKEHELFKSNLERVSVNVNMLQTKATRILYDKQQQQQRNVTKFEQLVNSLNSKWQMLLIYVDNRTRLIMAQINFYKYTDQVTTVLESLEHEYGREEDWYEKSKIEYDPEQYLQTQLQIHNQKKQSFLKACNWARRTGETFQKYSLRNICDAKINTNALSSIETNTKKIMDDIHNKEERTIKSWTNRKNSLDECFQYVIFEKSSKEALAWLHESEQSYLNKFQNLGNNKDEMKKLYKEFCEFTDRLKNQQGYVNLLIELSPKLLETSIRYGNNIAIWANKVETRYKEFFNIMSKVQQTYGLQVTSSNQTCTSPSSLSSSSMSINSTENSISTTTTNHTHSTTTTTSLTADSQKSIDNNQKLSLSSANETNKQQEILKHNEQKQKLIRKRQNIITEIIQTEKSYVQDLSDCLDSYYREFIVNSVSQPDYLKGKESIIFGNLEEIFSFHKKTFLVELENYENMPEDIGHCFVIYADQFQIYVEYCKNKENSTKILLEDGKNENYFEKLQRNGQLKCSLDSYLIKPIQRITKYQLLLKDLLSCCEDNRNETKDALDVMISVPKKANDAIHLSHLEGLEEGLSKDALGDVLLQDKFQVWDSKQLIKKAKDRHVFLFETSLVFAKEIKDQRGKLKYIYKFKLMTSEINITEHMEGDSCKLAVWTGRAPLSDHRVIMKTANLDIKQIWVKKIRELIQEKYFYMEVAMCEAGQRSNRNSKDFDLDTDFTTTSSNPHHNHHHHHNVNLNMISENFSSTASNASSGTKASNEVNCLTSDYTTADNIQLFKGQHVQIIQRLNNDTCLVHVINNSAESTSDLKSSKQLIEVQIPAQLIKMRNNKLHTDDSQSASSNFTENDESSKLPGLINSTAAAAAKRKGSFKKWLRSSHRKFTSNNGSTNNTTNTTITTSNGNRKSENEMNTQKYLNLSSGSDLKVLSNSEDIKMKNWLIEENNEDLDENNEEDLEENSNNDQEIATNSITISTSSLSKLNTNNTKNGDEDQEDMTSTIIPPPMNVIKPEHADQNTPSSFSKLPTQSIDIQRELKLWQSKMENSKKADAGNVLCEKINDLNNTTLTIQSNNSAAITDLNSSETMSNELNQTNTSVEKIQKPPESKLIYAIKELLNTEIDYVNDLAILIDKYMEAIKRNDIPMPQDMEGGKDKIVFGNIQQIYEWHKSTFSPELEKCLSESSSYIGQLFVKYENRFQMYVKYCENKPKSEYIVSEYDTYFDELRIKLNQKLNIQDLLIKPVQRIMKYQLMLKEIKKYMEKEGKDCKTINRAIEIMVTVPKNADDMMNVGRLQGFEGRITAQGRLLMQDTILVHEPDTDSKQKKDKQLKLKERRVFLFQQIVIFSEMIGSTKKFSSPRYVFKTDMKVNKMQFSKDDAQLQFTLTDKTPESNRKILCQCEDVNKYNIFVAQLQDLLDMQNEFLRNLQHPQLAMSKGSSSLGSNNNSMLNSSHSSASANNHNNNNNNNNHHHGNIITNTFNDFLKSTFSFSSSPGSNKSNNNSINSPVSPQTAPVLTNNTTNNNNTKSLKTAPVNMLSTSSSSTTSPTTSTTSTSNPYFSTTTTTPTPVGTTATPNTSIQNDHNLDKLNADLSQQLSLDNSEKNNNNNSSSNNSNIPNSAKVIGSYSAITEDEITVQKGDIVQIITANMHNRFLVHREANEHQPAAEGWIPGFVIGFQSTNLTLN